MGWDSGTWLGRTEWEMKTCRQPTCFHGSRGFPGPVGCQSVPVRIWGRDKSMSLGTEVRSRYVG